MEKKRRTLCPWTLWNPEAIQLWLEDEAAKGWRLTNWGSWLVTFTAVEPAACRVRLQPRRPEATEDWAARVETYRDMGWSYAAQIYDCEVYYCDDPIAPELYTDPVTLRWDWEKPLRRDMWICRFFLALAIVVLAAPLVVPGKSALDRLLDARLFSLLWLLLMLFLGILAARRLWTLGQMRRQLAEGLLPPPGDWRRHRRR